MAFQRGQILTPQEAQSLGLPPSGPQPGPAQAFQGQINSVVGGGSSALTNAAVNSATAPGKVAGENAGNQLTVNQLGQQDLVSQAKSVFNDPKNQGANHKVSPTTYNQQKAQVVGANLMTSKQFDDIFETQYTDPNNAYYATDDRVEALKTLPKIQNLIDQYLQTTGSDKVGPLSLPSIGGSFGAYGHLSDLLSSLGKGGSAPVNATTYENFRNNLASSIRDIVSAGQGSGFRFNMNELRQISDLLPSIYDTQEVAKGKIGKINGLLQTSFQSGLKLPPGFNAGQSSDLSDNPPSGLKGQIHVKIKKTGETGWIPPNEFDSSVYSSI